LTRISRITLAVPAALIALLLMARLRYTGSAPLKLQAENCDRELWRHIGEKEKLHVVEECTAVEGRVVSLSSAVDGDLYITLDPEQKSVLNLFNVMNGRGNLAVEVICEHAPANTADQAACGAFHSQITIPRSAIMSASPAPTLRTVTTDGEKSILLHASKFYAKGESSLGAQSAVSGIEGVSCVEGENRNTGLEASVTKSCEGAFPV
jgi:hypothetical protein